MDGLTFKELERQVEQLPPPQQFRLLARISEKLSTFTFDAASAKNGETKRVQQTPIAPTEFNTWLAECDRVANLWEGPFDSAADLRRLRDEE